jgi:hypothetical protein
MSVMLSYKSDDRAIAVKVHAHLRAAGLNAWIDQEQILPGQKWRDELLKQLRSCTACVPIITRAYLASEHCRLELFISRSFGRLILPVMAEECWADLDQFEETRTLARILGVKLYNLKSVGLPITEAEALDRLIEPLKQKPKPRKPGVYISYFADNAALATEVSRELNASGLPTWIATEDCIVGRDWREEQARAMFASACHLVPLRPGITQNEFLRTEVMLSEAAGIPIFPILEPEHDNEASIKAINLEMRGGNLVFDRLAERHAMKMARTRPHLDAASSKVLAETVRKHKPRKL